MGAQCTATAAAKAVGRSSCGGGNRPEPAWILGFKPKRTNLHEKYDYPEERVVHKEADRLAAAAEAVHCVGWTPDEVRSVLGIDDEILQEDPLARRYDVTPWAPWQPEQAAECFLAELRALQVERERIGERPEG